MVIYTLNLDYIFSNECINWSSGGGILAKHDFGIIDSFEDDKWYSDYEPEKYNCISVSDALIEQLLIRYLKEIGNLKTYFHVKKHPALGLDYCGTTIIPPSSLKDFKKIIINANVYYNSKELEKLIKKLNTAIRENKYVIHYGI